MIIKTRLIRIFYFILLASLPLFDVVDDCCAAGKGGAEPGLIMSGDEVLFLSMTISSGELGLSE